MLFRSYVPPGDHATVTARLLTRSAQSMRDLSVGSASTPDGRNEVDLPLAGLAPGEYIIELAMTSRAGEARDRLNFRVTN